MVSNEFNVSVIVPVYQVEAYIADCMKSLVSQTIENYEIILVNDGTKDNSIKIAKEILDASSAVYTIVNQENAGLPAARNSGIKIARGKYIISVDSDDCIHPDMLKNLYDSCNKYKLNICFSDFASIKSKEKLLEWDNYPYVNKIIERNEILMTYLIRKPAIHACTMLINKNFLFENNLLFDEKAVFSEDAIFIWKSLFCCDVVGYINAPYYHYYIRPMSIMTTMNIDKVNKGYERMKIMLSEIETQENKHIYKYILSRWVFGALRATIIRHKYKNFRDLSNNLEYKRHAKILKRFPDYRVRILSACMLCSRFIFYSIMKIIGKN